MKILELKEIIKEVFEKEKGMVKTVESVYEKGDQFLKLVISIHKLSSQDTEIIHTKFIFKVDEQKSNVLDDSFIYLYDINCVYHTINYSDTQDLKKKLENIIHSNKFGKDIQILSEFIDTPVILINHYFARNNVTNYNIEVVDYTPKFKVTPCEETTFDFLINLNNNYNINLCIKKEGDKKYLFIFKFIDKEYKEEVDSLLNMHFFIGAKIVDILDENLNKK